MWSLYQIDPWIDTDSLGYIFFLNGFIIIFLSNSEVLEDENQQFITGCIREKDASMRMEVGGSGDQQSPSPASLPAKCEVRK